MTLIRIILAVLATTIVSPGFAAAEDPLPYAPIQVTSEDIADYKWKARPLVIFADTPDDPDFRQQMTLIEQGLAELQRSDVVILIDSNPAAQSAIRRALRPHGFALVLVGLDGRVVFRKPAPWSVREITRAIDKIRE
jgi:hypothetical protein